MNDNGVTICLKWSVATLECFSYWHPLNNDWANDLAPEIQKIVRYAQQCLIAAQFTDKDLTHIYSQINMWRKTNPELIDTIYAPDLIFDENLGTQFDPGLFVKFLLTQQASLKYKPHKYTAFTLLKETAGLADLYIVGKKNVVSPVAQHLTIKITRFHAATVLLRRMNDNNDDNLPSIISLLLSHNRLP